MPRDRGSVRSVCAAIAAAGLASIVLTAAGEAQQSRPGASPTERPASNQANEPPSPAMTPAAPGAAAVQRTASSSESEGGAPAGAPPPAPMSPNPAQ